MFINNGAEERQEDILSGNLNLLDMISYEELLGVIFDASLFSWISPFMTTLGIMQFKRKNHLKIQSLRSSSQNKF